MSSPNQFRLLKQRRFAPFFWTMFLGAFNDNIYKNALVILVAFQGAKLLGFGSSDLVNLAGAIFIAPYILLSATAGQIADKYEKSGLIQRIKLLEISLMALGVAGFYWHSVPLLFAMLFGLGCQAALIGPVKYSFMPQHLNDTELTGGNGLVETGMYVAILGGTLLGGLLMADHVHGAMFVALGTFTCAVMGYLLSRLIPKSPSDDANLKINWNLLTETARNWQMLQGQRTLRLAILGNSWFWFYGAIILAQIPAYTQTILHGDESVTTLLLAVFSVGIGCGSLLCERLSRGRVEIGLVPFGAFGLTIFALILVWIKAPSVAIGTTLTAMQLLHDPQGWKILATLALIGMFGGFYIVPLYAMLQADAKPSERARVIAANNIMNAIFIVVSAVFAIILFRLNFTILQLFFAVAVLNALVAIYIFTLVPQFMVRFVLWLLINTIYRVRSEGLEHIPETGPALLICNHVSYVDALIIGTEIHRPPRFIMDHLIFKTPVLGGFFRTMRAIPIASSKEDPTLKEKAFDAAAQALRDGDLVMIFPEGTLTKTGDFNTFRSGMLEILQREPVPVIPMALRGLWGSFFSRIEGGTAMIRPFRRGILNRVELVVAAPIAPSEVSMEKLQQQVAEMRGDLK
ncbi:MAG: MFS transporter [Gammaproteobacteria bacterium]|nr:MFS transporter [Gammaproteobacteria bacterium]